MYDCVTAPTDVCMCLSMVWYLSNTGAESGGTWCVPGSHRSALNPRGPTDGITVSAPIPGEIQCEGPAGSLFIQDTRTWHSSACWSPRPRTALVVRYAPWWLSVGEFGQVHAVPLARAQIVVIRDLMVCACAGRTGPNWWPSADASATGEILGRPTVAGTAPVHGRAFPHAASPSSGSGRGSSATQQLGL